MILIGYSLGADILPFMASRLPPEVLDRVKLIALLGPGERVDFEFHVSEWVTGVAPKSALSVMPEVQKLQGLKLLCFYGEQEEDSLCPKLDPGLAKVIATKGKHHFGGGYEAIAQRILKETP